MSINSPPKNHHKSSRFFYSPNFDAQNTEVEFKKDLNQLQAKQDCPINDFIPKEDFLKKFKISRGMYTNLKKSRILKDYKLGGKYYLKKSELLTTLENNKS